jgi:lipoate synthase
MYIKELTDEICDVAQKPNNEECHAEAISTFGLVVGEQLG